MRPVPGNERNPDIRRRRFLIDSLRLGGAFLVAGRKGWSAPPAGPVPAGAYDFVGEGDPPLERLIGSGPDARRFSDLSRIRLDGTAPADSPFFVRTGPPRGLPARADWSINILGLGSTTPGLRLPEIEAASRPRGFSVLECSGNDPGGRFGLLGGAHWEGALLGDLFRALRRRGGVAGSPAWVRVTGWDEGPLSPGDRPEASWIFSEKDLLAAKAFLATGINGAALPSENGGPVRLMIPGWYGCACIKWVRSMEWLDGDPPATPFMREYAGRTHQDGIPATAGAFRPAIMQWGALPIRVERHVKAGRAGYRVIGLAWGGDKTETPLQIRIGSGDWQDVIVRAPRRTHAGWSVWTYRWEPAAAGEYPIRLRVPGAKRGSLRSDGDWYLRICRIDM